MPIDVPITPPPHNTPPKKERNEFEHVGWPHHTHRESAKLSQNGKFGRRAEAENNSEQVVMLNENKKSKNLQWQWQELPYGTLRTGDVEDSDVEDTTLRTATLRTDDFEDRRL